MALKEDPLPYGTPRSTGESRRRRSYVILVLLLATVGMLIRLTHMTGPEEVRNVLTTAHSSVPQDLLNLTSEKMIESLNKTEVHCPIQDAHTGVLLVIGQSNAANFAEIRQSTRFPNQVSNYFEGKCFVAASPLLGAGGGEGEFITPLADILIEKQIYEKVVIFSLGVGGSKIDAWSAQGDLNKRMIEVLKSATEYRITDVIWHQGEADFTNRTTSTEYGQRFQSLQQSLTEHGIDAPMFIAIATKCGYDEIWVKSNEIAVAQRGLIDNKHVFLGADTDDLLGPEDRRPDECHLSGSGQIKVAESYAKAISSYWSSN